jgi:hypothetical protein
LKAAWIGSRIATDNNEYRGDFKSPAQPKNGRAIGVVRLEKAPHTVAFLISARVAPLGRPISSRIFSALKGIL